MNVKTMKNLISKVKQHAKSSAKNSLIYHEYYHKKIDENLVYVESRDAKDFTGNILRLVEELSSGKYGNLKIFIYAKKDIHPRIRELEKNYSLKIYKITDSELTALKAMERAKYILTDSSLNYRYVKRPGQIVLNTWHGTPLKTMGRFNKAEEHRCGNVQQVFFASDYLLYPNDFMKEKILNGYMMENTYPGTILLEGYPRNSVFFNEERGKELKRKLGFENKELFAYMPTYRGMMLDRKDEEQSNTIKNYLYQIDAKLKDNQILLVKLHVFNQKGIDFSSFKHIQEFPNNYEPYDILNMTEALITDYSSVFFDYANTRRKIILFNYDEDEYMKDRGTYIPLSDLPFPKVQEADELIEELNSPKDYDDEEFLKEFCKYDNPNTTENICQHIFNGKKLSKEEKIVKDKKNVLIFAGGLKNNGITTSLINLLSNLDRTKYNFFISYRTWDPYIQENHEKIFSLFPDNIEFAPLKNKITPGLYEKYQLNKFTKSKKSKLPKTLDKLYEREYQKAFGGYDFDSVIQFNGYGIDENLMFSKAPTNKTIWVHSNMLEELNKKSNQRYSVLRYAYNSYDNVAVVSQELIRPTSEISGREDNIKVVSNINNYKKIMEQAEKSIETDENTTVFTKNPNGIQGVLSSPGKKFITIGRYSLEKCHKRLINCFDEFSKDYPDTQLIIIGGEGDEYESTKKLVEEKECSENITLIKSISNPMPILKGCDLFILPSLYEGLGIVVMEADTLKIPIITTDVSGLQWVKEHNGYTVKNDEESILKGMYDFMEGKVPDSLGIDYEEYNKKAIEEFMKII